MGDMKKNVRIGWVKLGKVWWPGKLMSPDEITDEMKAEINGLQTKRKSLKRENIHVVKFLNEPDYEVVHNPAQILIDVDDEKKMDIIKRAISTMKTSSLSANYIKFEKDVLDAERLVNPSADLTNLTHLLKGESLEPKKPSGMGKYADIFPSAKPEKPLTPISSLKSKASSPGLKFNFPSSRIITTASSKSPSKVAPLPSDPSKKYKCSSCPFSADRVNVITSHMKYCPGKKQRITQPTAAAPSSSPPKLKVTKVVTPTSASPLSPVRRPPGRPPRQTPSITTSLPKPKATPSSPSTSLATPKKRGRRRKDKQSEKQKAEILNDWNDSTSEDADSDDDIHMQMPPTKPPELFLFGSEKKKRKAVEAEEDKVITEGGETAAAAGNEDEPPVLKKPRTDKELSAAFEALLKNTKPEYEQLLEKDLPGDKIPESENEDEEMEVDEENHMSDIEEDAHIVMKKVDAKVGSIKLPETPSTQEDESDKKEEKDEEKPDAKIEKNSTPKRRSTDEDREGASGKLKASSAEETVRKATDNTETTPSKVETEESKDSKEEVTETDIKKAKTSKVEILTDESKAPLKHVPGTLEKNQINKKDDSKSKLGEQEKPNEKPPNSRSKRQSKTVSVDTYTSPVKKPAQSKSKSVSTPSPAPVIATKSAPLVMQVMATTNVKNIKLQTTEIRSRAKAARSLTSPRKTTPAATILSNPVTPSKKSTLAALPSSVSAVKKSVAATSVELSFEAAIVTTPLPSKRLSKKTAQRVNSTPVSTTITRRSAKATAKVPTPTHENKSTRSSTKAQKEKLIEPAKLADQTLGFQKLAEKTSVTGEKIPKQSSTTTALPTKQDIEVSPKPAELVHSETTQSSDQSSALSAKLGEPSTAVLQQKSAKQSLTTKKSTRKTSSKVAEKTPVSLKNSVEEPPCALAVANAKPVEPTLTAQESVKPIEPTLAAQESVKPIELPSTAQESVKPLELPSTAKESVKPLEIPSTAKESVKPLELPSTAQASVKPILPPSTVQASVKPIELPSTAQASVKPILPPSTVQASVKPIEVPSTAQASVKPSLPPSTDQASVKPIEVPSTAQASVKPIEQTAIAPPKQPALPTPPTTSTIVEEKSLAPVIPEQKVIPSPSIVSSPATTEPVQKPSPSPQPPQKKPTAAVRPLVDTNTTQSQVQKDAPLLPPKDTKSTAAKSPQKPPTDQPQQMAPPTQQTKEESKDGDDDKKSASLVTQRVVHLVPVENADGTITYMLLSLENGNDNPAVVLDQGGADQAGSVLRLDKVEPPDPTGPPNHNHPLNSEVEGVFLDKNVDSANQIVSALVSAPTATSTTDAAAGSLPQSIAITEGSAAAQEGIAGEAESQQVYYMTEDGALLDPRSLGLTFEQLQQLLN